MGECFYSRLTLWRDPSLSAAFLTGGNLLVVLLLVSGDALAWLQFFLVFCVMPLGFIARLTGLDRYLSEISAPASPHERARSYYETHVYSQLTGFGFLKFGVYLVVTGVLIASLGIPVLIGLAGNLVMLAPLLWEWYGAQAIDQVRQIEVPVINTIESAKKIFKTGIETVESIGPMAPAVSAGLAVFVAVIVVSELVQSTALLVANLKAVGYVMILVCAFTPISTLENLIKIATPSPSAVEEYSKSVHADEWIKRATELVLWENYKASLSAFVSLYAFYFISSLVGVAVPIALGAAGFVGFTLTPYVLKEKALAEMDRLVEKVKERVPPLYVSKAAKTDPQYVDE